MKPYLASVFAAAILLIAFGAGAQDEPPPAEATQPTEPSKTESPINEALIRAYFESELRARDPERALIEEVRAIRLLGERLSEQSKKIDELSAVRQSEAGLERLTQIGAQLEALTQQIEAQNKQLEELKAGIEAQGKKTEELDTGIKGQTEQLKGQQTDIAKLFEELKKSSDAATKRSNDLGNRLQIAIDVLKERNMADFDTEIFDGIEFVKIPAGSFVMGTSPEQVEELRARESWSELYSSEVPARKVTITRPFLISIYEVDQGRWASLMGRRVSPAFKGDRLPMERVSLNDVQQFMAAAERRTKAKYRLPTEAEWEYCARAGGKGLFGLGADGEEVTFETLDPYAWTTANSENKTQRVGAKSPNAWGLHDMYGNVWEWCQDWFDAGFYAKGSEQDPLNSEKGAERIFRGGCWELEPQFARAAFRGANLESFRSPYLGFRVVRELRSGE